MRNCKEYLEKQEDGTYALVLRGDLCKESDILIPEGAVKLLYSKENNGNYHFANENNKLMSLTDINFGKPHWYGNAKNYMKQCEVDVLWQREQDEPFLTPECTLNDQYAEIEQVRQALKDNVNHPSHYTQGKVECIDALESATIGKSGIEAVCVANVIKYLWRYEDKGGLESILKAKWYLDKLIECKK